MSKLLKRDVLAAHDRWARDYQRETENGRDLFAKVRR